MARATPRSPRLCHILCHSCVNFAS